MHGLRQTYVLHATDVWNETMPFFPSPYPLPSPLPPPLYSDQLAGENSQKNAELKLKEDEVAILKGEISRLSKLREGVHKKLRSVEEQKAEVESARDSLKQQIASLERGEWSGLCAQEQFYRKRHSLHLRMRKGIMRVEVRKALNALALVNPQRTIFTYTARLDLGDIIINAFQLH